MNDAKGYPRIGGGAAQSLDDGLTTIRMGMRMAAGGGLTAMTDGRTA